LEQDESDREKGAAHNDADYERDSADDAYPQSQVFSERLVERFARNLCA
jgi:hypothetical protein